MKRIFFRSIGFILLIVGVCCSFSSCSFNRGISIASCELIKATDNVNGIFKILNSEKSRIDNLSITVKAFDKSRNELGTYEGTYSIYVNPDNEATITVALPKETVSAKAISCTYILDSKKRTEEFESISDAVFPVTTTEKSKFDTREELAEHLIEDIEHQFMLKKFEAHGYYDKENNRVIIASYTTKTYSECQYARSIDPTIYNDLTESIKQMSLTCYEEFQNYNFKDVEVSVGFLSSDEKIMISATNGTIVDNFN